MLSVVYHDIRDSKAKVDINQGIDIRIMTEEKAELIKKIRVKAIHFAWDRYEDREIILPKLKYFKGQAIKFGSHSTMFFCPFQNSDMSATFRDFFPSLHPT